MTTVAIVGTAGRRDAATRLTYPLWLGMVREAERFLAGLPRPWDVVSGGAAWADHVAVRLFLDGKVNSLALYLPTDFCMFGHEFLPSPSDTACTANHYHRAFTEAVRATGGPSDFDSLDEVAEAIRRGTRIEVGAGFKSRNYGVGRTEALLAFTFGEGKVPADGGTAHTWRTSAAPLKVHVPLGTLLEEQAGRLL